MDLCYSSPCSLALHTRCLFNAPSLRYDKKDREWRSEGLCVHAVLKVRGLCGTLTWNQHDDFTTAEGDVENSVSSFAGKFTRGHCSLPQGAPPDPCATYTQRKQYAETLCSVIHSPVFQVHRMDSSSPRWTFPFFRLLPCRLCRRVMMWWRGNPTSASVSQRFAAATPRGRVTAMFLPPSPATVLKRAPLSAGATRPSAVSL